MEFTLTAPLVFPSGVQLTMRSALRNRVEGDSMPLGNLLSDNVEVDAAESADRPGEVIVHKVLAQTDCLEDLCTRVRRDSGDTHLGHHLENAIAAGLHVVGFGLLDVDFAQAVSVCGDHLLDCLERSVGVHGGRAIADEQTQWCTSRASPVSTTSPTLVRCLVRIRW